MSHDPRELLARAANLIDARGADYGQIENNFQLIADLASLRLGRNIHPFEIATIMCCVKSARLFANPTHIDSRLDLCNYETFAAMFAEDYAHSASNDIDWKKKAQLHKAEMVTPAFAPTEAPRTTEELGDLLDVLNEKITTRRKSPAPVGA